MMFTRPSRKLLSVITLLALLFSQLAVAAYACPEMAVAVVQQMEEGEQAMPCCADPDPEAPHLCWQHYQAGKQSADRPDVPTVSAVVAILQVQPAPPLAVPPVPAPGTFHPPVLDRSVEPPVSIRNCCFRT